MSTTADTEQLARVGDVELCYEVLGPADGPPLLLVMGLGCQMIWWEDEFCRLLTDAGRRVIRFDNRDVGRSTIFSDSPPPSTRQLMLRDKRGTAYPLDALAADAVGLLDHLGIERAPIVGASMGGMIVQLMAINHPERVSSMVSIMSTTGSRRVGNPKPTMVRMLLGPPADGRDAYLSDVVKTFTAIGSRTHPPDPAILRALGERAWERGYHAAGTARQLAAINTTWNRTRKLRGLRIPTTVIHGWEDPLVSPSGGLATARAIPDSRLVMFAGMGHDMPRALWPQIADAILTTS